MQLRMMIRPLSQDALYTNTGRLAYSQALPRTNALQVTHGDANHLQ